MLDHLYRISLIQHIIEGVNSYHSPAINAFLVTAQGAFAMHLAGLMRTAVGLVLSTHPAKLATPHSGNHGEIRHQGIPAQKPKSYLLETKRYKMYPNSETPEYPNFCTSLNGKLMSKMLLQ